MTETINVAVPADLLPLLRTIVDDNRVWQTRMQHDWSGAPEPNAARMSSNAGRRAGQCFALLQAIDAAAEAAR